MKPISTDPMRQYNRFFAAVCDDLFDTIVHGSKGTPRADAVCEISRQMRQQSNTREAGAVQQTARTNHGD